MCIDFSTKCLENDAMRNSIYHRCRYMSGYLETSNGILIEKDYK